MTAQLPSSRRGADRLLAARLLAGSLRAYAGLLRMYPPAYRARFAPEMAQVFRGLCQDTCRRTGAPGLLRLWPAVLADQFWTAAYQWLVNLLKERKTPMDTALERQLGDMIWSISCGIRAGYSVREVFTALAAEAPEPAAAAARRFLAALDSGADFTAALCAWKAASPSPALARLADLIGQHQQSGGNLADLIDPLGEELLREQGSDPAFYPAMRRQAAALGAAVPQRADSV